MSRLVRENFWAFATIALFVGIWQIISNHRLIRLKKLVSSRTKYGLTYIGHHYSRDIHKGRMHMCLYGWVCVPA